ncbi:MAG: Sir2 family NAD-dependent protein deacetylase [Planctomycetota bacterium]|nr:Sir2 family NAD-dependent protein deacetylase [Planctomycetota bacterium]
MVDRFDESSVTQAAERVRQLLADSRSTVAFTGAGISTESGIPDFRSPGGVWAQNQPVYFDDFMSSEDARYEYWRQKAQAHQDFADAQPNITHHTLAEWERDGRLVGIVTQNIDGLHQAAGSQNVLELHGTAREVACMDCDWREPADRWVRYCLTEDKVPECPSCGKARVKHATISFGQSLPTEVLRTASSWSRQAELYFALGSSLVVHPAAGLPQMAAESGAKLVILNRDETPLDALATAIVRAPLGDFFRSLAELGS